jgi:tetratricopeptide (TPR) repeat protein
MNNCPECGTPIPTGQKKCPSCGITPMNLGVEVTAHINLLKKKIEKEPANTTLYIELGDIYQKHGFLEEALSEYQKAINLDANNYETQIKSANIFLKFKKLDEAGKAFRNALHLDPKSTDSLIGLFRTYYLQDKVAEAIVIGEKIVKSKPDNVEFHMLLKNLYNQKGDMEKVMTELEKLESLIPSSKQIVKEIIQQYKKDNNIEKLIEYYPKMRDMEIEDTDLGIQIGRYYYDNQKYDKAIEHLNSLLEKETVTPNTDALIRTYLALAHLNNNNILDAASTVNEIEPDSAQQMDKETQKKLASLFFKIGQDALKDKRAKEAIASFEKAVTYDKETIEYGQMLDKTINQAAVSDKKLMKKISVIALGAIAVCILIVLVWVLIRNKIIIQVEPAEDITVLIDGKSMKTESVQPGVISSPILFIGKHDIVIEKKGYEKWQGSANIKIGKPARLEVKLVPIYFLLKLSSVPESAAVTIDGQFVGKTPFASDRILWCPHVIELESKGHAKWRATLTAIENDSVDLGVIKLKNLAGKWYGKIGADGYAYTAAFSMIIQQTNTNLTIKYYHKPREGFSYAGKLKGKIKNGAFYAEGNVTYRYIRMFYRAVTKQKIVMQGKISNNWDRIEGTHFTEGLGQHDWWANR